MSDHCDGERFFNPHEPGERSLADVARWMLTRARTPWPQSVPLTPHAAPPQAVEPGRVAVTFIGHSTFLIRTASAVLITDPVFTPHAGPLGRLGPRRVRPPALAPADLPPVDLVLLSHNHYDHLQPSSLAAFRGRASYVAPLGLRGLLPSPSEPAGAGRDTAPIRSATRVELDWWESTRAGAADITCVPAQHFSARTPWDRNATLWCGFIVSVDGLTIYFAGDTGYAPHFAEIARRVPPIDLALLPIGAYEPRWFMQPVHMNPEEAVRAHRDLGSRISIGMHFGTFQLTDEGIDEPIRALARAREANGVEERAFRTLDFGETAMIQGGDRSG